MEKEGSPISHFNISQMNSGKIALIHYDYACEPIQLAIALLRQMLANFDAEWHFLSLLNFVAKQLFSIGFNNNQIQLKQY